MLGMGGPDRTEKTPGPLAAMAGPRGAGEASEPPSGALWEGRGVSLVGGGSWGSRAPPGSDCGGWG